MREAGLALERRDGGRWRRQREGEWQGREILGKGVIYVLISRVI